MKQFPVLPRQNYRLGFYKPPGQSSVILKVGDGATLSLWSDRQAGTVAAIKGSKQRTVVWQRDKVTRLTDPKVVPGGFAGVCVNNQDIKYSYEPDPEGVVEEFTYRKNGRLVKKGWEAKNGISLNPGRSEFYDYNF